MKTVLRIFLAFFFLGIFTVSGLFLAYRHLENWGDNTVKLENPVVIELSKGMTLKKFSHMLFQKGIVDSDLKFEYWMRFFSDYSKFQAGPYIFSKKVSPKKIVAKISSGSVYQPVIYSITIPEGFTYKQLSAKLAEQKIEGVDELDKLFTDKTFLAELNIPSTTLEGFIYPATYPFLKRPTAKEIIKKAVKTFWRRLPLDYNQDLEEKNISLLEGITFASLIELETPQREEKPMIAEVIWRRLKANMPLGIDAAIIYGIKDYNGNITAKHLADVTNPYNTRKHKGLPPTPISSPSLDSILAVLRPTNFGNYYFVVDPENPKHHVFAKNLKEHTQNVRRYVSASKQARIAERKRKAEEAKEAQVLAKEEK